MGGGVTVAFNPAQGHTVSISQLEHIDWDYISMQMSNNFHLNRRLCKGHRVQPFPALFTGSSIESLLTFCSTCIQFSFYCCVYNCETVNPFVVF